MKKQFIAVLLAIAMVATVTFTTTSCDVSINSIPSPGVMKLSEFQIFDNKAYLNIANIAPLSHTNLWKDFVILEKMNIKNVIIHINSGGGRVNAAFAIIDAIEAAKNRGFYITTIGRGLVASAAVLIYVTGDYRITSKRALFMIHEIKIVDRYGNRNKALEEEFKYSMDSGNKSMRNIFTKYTKMSKEQIDKFTSGEKWFNAEDAIKWGIADKVE